MYSAELEPMYILYDENFRRNNVDAQFVLSLGGKRKQLQMSRQYCMFFFTDLGGGREYRDRLTEFACFALPPLEN